MYSNYMYSNAPASSRRGGGSWVYVNGELYHVGIKGMQWGKHLPGTVWWKKTTNSNMGGWRPGGKYSLGERIVGNLKTAGQAAKIYGGYIKDAPRYYSGKVRDSSKREYYSNKKSFEKLGTANMTHLQSYMSKQIEDGRKAIERLSDNPRSGIATINLAIQNAQFNILNGINNFLTRNGLADKVDNFISKFIGNSSRMNLLNEVNSQDARKGTGYSSNQHQYNKAQYEAKSMANLKRQDEANVKRLTDQAFINQQAALRRQDNSNAKRLSDQAFINQQAALRRQDYADDNRRLALIRQHSRRNRQTR